MYHIPVRDYEYKDPAVIEFTSFCGNSGNFCRFSGKFIYLTEHAVLPCF